MRVSWGRQELRANTLMLRCQPSAGVLNHTSLESGGSFPKKAFFFLVQMHAPCRSVFTRSTSVGMTGQISLLQGSKGSARRVVQFISRTWAAAARNRRQ